MNIRTFEGGLDRNFSYLLWTDNASGAVLVDPATAEGPVRATLEGLGVQLSHILITHTHGDHLVELEAWTGTVPPVAVMGHVTPMRRAITHYRGIPDSGDLSVAGLRFRLIETPGHYPDSVCWHELTSGSLFTGDTIFVGRTGRTVGGSSDIGALYRSVYHRLLTLPRETVVYPGHNYGPVPTATIGELIERYDFFGCRSESEFREVMARYEDSRRSGT
ncbi:MAG: MBL fold metallo-hydrolase [Candidatus Neomarinimicrobiota bacterium]